MMGGQKGQAIVAARGIEPIDARKFGEPPAGAVADEHGDEIDRLGDERARHRHHRFLDALLHPPERADRTAGMDGRSEEHTSELQSLMRLSYAVFCLKKKQHTSE